MEVAVKVIDKQVRGVAASRMRFGTRVVYTHRRRIVVYAARRRIVYTRRVVYAARRMGEAHIRDA